MHFAQEFISQTYRVPQNSWKRIMALFVVLVTKVILCLVIRLILQDHNARFANKWASLILVARGLIIKVSLKAVINFAPRPAL